MSDTPAPDTGLRARAARFVETPAFRHAITALIVINAVTLGLETSERVMGFAGTIIAGLDRAILGVFVAEIALKMFARGHRFFKEPWNIFDFAVVAIALVPAAGPFSVLRAFRVLRVLRLVSVVPAMRRVVQALLRSIPGVASVVSLLALVFYVFSVICTKLYGKAFPDWFGTVGESMYSLFQIMTLESWSMGIVRPVMEAFPFAWLLFIPFIITTAFAVLNLFIGVIVDAMQTEHEADAKGEREAMREDTQAILLEVRELRAEIAAMKAGRD